MQEPKDLSENSAQYWVYLRNAFYKKKYHFVLSIYFCCIISVIVLAVILFYLWRNPTQPLYFVTDDLGRLIQEMPLQQPNMRTEEVAAWAIEAVENAFSFDYMNYRSELQGAQKYFTDYGWRTFMEGLKTSNNLIALTQRKMIIIAKVVDKPKLEVEGILGGAYAWKFTMPVLITYMLPPFNDKSKFQNPLAVSVLVQRQKLLQSYKGLGVVQMIGNLILNAPVQSLTPPQQP